jgi:hypothetical protein
MFTEKLKEYAPWIIGGVVAILAAMGSAWVTQTRVSVQLKQDFEKSFGAQVTLTAQAEQLATERLIQIQKLQHENEEASAFKKRVAKVGADGKLLLDGRGWPVYDFEQGSHSASTRDLALGVIDERQAQFNVTLRQMNADIATYQKEATDLQEKLSKASSLGWGPVLAVGILSFADMQAYNYGAGADIDLALGAWRWNMALTAEPPSKGPVFEGGLANWGTRLQLAIH